MSLSQVGGKTYSNNALAATAIQAATGSLLLFNIRTFNPDAAAATFLQFFDALVANVIVGTTVPYFVLPMKIGGDYNVSMSCPIKFTTGIVVATASTATGAGAPGTASVTSLDYVSG